MQNGNQSSGHTLTLTGRANAVVTGVEDVDCFNEQIVVLRTPLGALTISGENLNISQLSLNDGRLVVEGDIVSCEYSEKKKTGGSGFWGKLFG